MRTTTLALLALAATTGCTTNTTFQHTSMLDTNTRGFALHDDGESGQAGMGGATCEIETRDGGITEDVDVANGEDEVIDAGPGIALVRDGDDLHVYEPGSFDWDDYTPDVSVPGLSDAILVEGGIVTVGGNDDCAVAWHLADGGSVDIPADLCDGAVLTVDSETGTVFVAGGGQIASVDDNGVTILDEGDLAIWDAAAAVLYVADLDGTEVRGIETDGTLRFAADVGGMVTSLDAMGPRAQAAVMIERSDGHGELVLVDGFTGDILSSLATPTAAKRIDVSADGSTLAAILDNEVHFFSAE